jgi:hypothetical protein
MTWTLSLVVKSTLVLAAAAAVARALGRSSAATRHALWSLALLSLLALPVLSAALPPLGLPVVPAIAPEAVRPPNEPAAPEKVRAPLDGAALSSTPSLWSGVLLAWLAGVGLALAHAARASVLVGRAVRRARPVTTPEWNALLQDATATLGVRRRVELRQSDASTCRTSRTTDRRSCCFPRRRTAGPRDSGAPSCSMRSPMSRVTIA